MTLQFSKVHLKDNKKAFLAAMVDIEKVKREVDVKTLQDNVANIAFCDVENELVKFLLKFSVCIPE